MQRLTLMVEEDTNTQASLQLSVAIHLREEKSVTLPLGRRDGLNVARRDRPRNILIMHVAIKNNAMWVKSYA